MTIRNAAKALIVNENKIMLIKHETDKICYTLPGGGQNHQETLSEAVQRECLEELGAMVLVHDIVFAFEYIASRHENSIHNESFHQVDVVFSCELLEQTDTFTEMDRTQTGYEWIDIEKLSTITMYPMALRKKIINHTSKIYLGEM